MIYSNDAEDSQNNYYGIDNIFKKSKQLIYLVLFLLYNYSHG